jgi:hypothetical protein
MVVLGFGIKNIAVAISFGRKSDSEVIITSGDQGPLEYQKADKTHTARFIKIGECRMARLGMENLFCSKERTPRKVELILL